MWLIGLVLLGGTVLYAAYGASQKKNAPSNPASTTRTKKKLTGKNEKLIGLDDPSYRYTSDQGANTGFTIDTFDTTTHGDRAILRLHNTSGGQRVLYDNAIYGKPVIQIAGIGGYLWEYSDYDDIDQNGEEFVEISNKYIISAAQCEDIGDYAWKKLSRHAAYSFNIAGAHPEIEPGQIYQLTLTYTLNGNTVENIDSAIEVQSVSIERPYDPNNATMGTTSITGVIYDGAWSKTNSTRSRIVGAGRPQWMQSRNNTIVVASKDYAKGDADYYCDGVADDAEINAALLRLNEIGGGELHLTDGPFDITGPNGIYFNQYSNIILSGEGTNTVLTHSDAISSKYVITLTNSDNIYIRNMMIDGDNVAHATICAGIYITWSDGATSARIDNVKMKNIAGTGSAAGIGVNSIGAIIDVSNCSFVDFTGGTYAYGIAYADRVHACYVNNMDASPSGTAVGIWGSKKCSLNRVDTLTGSSTSKYGTGAYQSYADAGTSYACADTPNGGFNS